MCDGRMTLCPRNEDAEASSANVGNWILDLFTPTSFASTNVLPDNCIVSTGANVKYISPNNAHLMKDMFHRVHAAIMNGGQGKQEEISTDDDVLQDVHHFPDAKVDVMNTGKCNCTIWNLDELSALREAYQSANIKSSGLEFKVHQIMEHNNELKNKLVSHENELESKTKKLSEAIKANQRLKIHRDEVIKELYVVNLKLDAITKMWKEIDTDKMKLMKENKVTRSALDGERLCHEHLVHELEEAKKQASAESSLAEESLKARYELRISSLEAEIQSIGCRMEEEKDEHSKTREALQHLLSHFSDIQPRDCASPALLVVDRDQISYIDYIGS